MFTEKERLERALRQEEVDRPPCICPGGMMNMITTDLMDACGVTWPEAHTDAQMMADLALASYQHGCFENVGVPFCMTIEAEEELKKFNDMMVGREIKMTEMKHRIAELEKMLAEK